MLDAGVLRLAGGIRIIPRKKSDQMIKMVLTVLKVYEYTLKSWEIYFSQLV